MAKEIHDAHASFNKCHEGNKLQNNDGGPSLGEGSQKASLKGEAET